MVDGCFGGVAGDLDGRFVMGFTNRLLGRKKDEEEVGKERLAEDREVV